MQRKDGRKKKNDWSREGVMDGLRTATAAAGEVFGLQMFPQEAPQTLKKKEK